ncbi:lysine N(6)-hydroxylase/L-ornithine N(5)-oxygenase family protein [Corynebacterium atypicum]|uniref:lysine N(6)-hydroxylase/L-ornithine N(5)-oxygenase family protein n=1 Tax=Corynebacterium atypicum TaxID=191610 RepID=UPI000691EC8F|nr:SidA/IucD/PvdA family monooxygenase [Corynebacterium atypicum]
MTTDLTAGASRKDPLDLVGIGVGPFNLGLAALAEPLVSGGTLRAEFFDQRPRFCWHEGMLLPHATIQVPFLADLVTMADPTSRFSFLNYLKAKRRIHQFYIRESFFPLRSEYSDYCAWVAAQLPYVHWDSAVTRVRRTEDGLWDVQLASGRQVLTRHIAMGVGTEPFVPQELAEGLTQPGVCHSSEYLRHREELQQADSVTIIGSGQSAAEIYFDLMDHAAARGHRLDWLTRSPRFFPMEYTKLTLEMTAPEYAAYFHRLGVARRDELGRSQRNLYKGISGELINAIYDNLYRLATHTPLDTTLRCGQAARWSGTQLDVEDLETGQSYPQRSAAYVLATGYRAPAVPSFLSGAVDAGQLRLDSRGRLDVGLEFEADDAGTFFVLNGEEHTHGLSAPDLGMGPWRNSVILARILGREVYPIERRIAFQSFGLGPQAYGEEVEPAADRPAR